MSKKRHAKPITFRLYPEGTFLYAEINIWPNKKAMHAHARLPGHNYEACCGGRIAYQVPAKGRMRKTGLFAEANFNRNRLGIEIVSHELTHAAFAFAERRKIRLEQATDKSFSEGARLAVMEHDGPEERFCYALGVMCRQFTQKCYELGLYEDLSSTKDR
jgi:hypothetical protein